MTTETREALKGLAQVVKKLAAAVSLRENDAQFYPTIQLHADRLIRALEQEGNVPTCSVCEGSGVIDPWGTAMRTPCPSCQREAALRHIERESTVKAIATNYETWRDEQLDTLRKLFRQRGFSDGYKSFPDFCREQWEGNQGGCDKEKGCTYSCHVASLPNVTGMSLRDWFAGMALQMIVINDVSGRPENFHEHYAKGAYEWADAMIAARDRATASEKPLTP